MFPEQKPNLQELEALGAGGGPCLTSRGTQRPETRRQGRTGGWEDSNPPKEKKSQRKVRSKQGPQHPLPAPPPQLGGPPGPQGS